MLFEKIKHWKEKDFRRKTGVKRATFEEMVNVLVKSREHRSSRRGNQSVLTAEDWVLILLKYYREYVTYLSIAFDVGVSESTVCRIIKKTEKILLTSKQFHLPGKKQLASSVTYEVIVVDATETEIERPKKNKNVFTRGRSDDTVSKRS